MNVQGARLCGNTLLQVDGMAQNTLASVCGKCLTVSKSGFRLKFDFADCTAPFSVHIKTDGGADGGIETTQRGICFDYMQIPC